MNQNTQKENQSLVEYINSPGQNNKVKLHLGCGGIKWKDFINIDLYPDNNLPNSSRSG